MTHFECFGTVFEGKSNCRSCTPVVVIDPEDREAVERLADVVLTEAAGYRIDRAILAVGLGKGLREFANPKPPKPEEPTGLGAVVLSLTGAKYVRLGSGSHGWFHANALLSDRDGYSYAHIAAVTVLSEGVPD